MKVLIALSGLSIGGVETHALLLAKELKNEGHEVTLLSSGGVLQARCDLPHIFAPIISRRVGDMIRSARILFSLLQRERFDIIHAHTRPAALLCSLIAPLFGIPVVTSAHGIYSTSPIKRRLTVLGEGTIAVSPRIKEHLVRKFGAEEKNILLSVNGIDREMFFPAKKRTGKDAPLLHVSRLDGDSSRCAEMLISISPMLKKAFPAYRLQIAGDGSERRRLMHTASGMPYIQFLGARTDIPPLLRRSCGAVGVSRAALEAMACGLPTILCGNRGGLGLFTEKLGSFVPFTQRKKLLPLSSLSVWKSAPSFPDVTYESPLLLSDDVDSAFMKISVSE